MTQDNPADPGARSTQVVHEAGTGRPILVAPGRQVRPLKTVAGRDGSHGCPFCAGAEAETPPERDAIRRDGSAPDTPGWRARAFPNLFPAARWHEVVAEGPEHQIQPGRVPVADWLDVVALWRRRLAWLEAQDGVGCAFLFKNVGREAGASIAHNHSQILGLPEPPPRLLAELAAERREGSLVRRELEGARRDGRVIAETGAYTVLAPRHPRLPHETWIVPHDGATPFDDSAKHDGELVAALRGVCAAIDRAFASTPFNVWLHRVPGVDFHWHFEVQPRTGFLAGLELGGDMFINTVPAAEGAARIRGAWEEVCDHAG